MKTTVSITPDLASTNGTAVKGRESVASPPDYASWIFAAAFLALYTPIVIDSAKFWLTNDSYSHGFLVLPCSMFLIWMQRERIVKAERKPTLWGLVPLCFGLLVQMAAYILQIKYIGLWSMIPTLAGAILLLYGSEIWGYCRFPVAFIAFAAPFSGTFIGNTTGSLQWLSTVCSTALMGLLGFTVSNNGNVINVPGSVLEIANACSGFHSIISMLAFSSIYAYLFTGENWKRLILIVASLPIAIAMNIVRISVLIAAATFGGMHSYHLVHDPAAIGEILCDFALLVLLGRSLSCDTLRFAQ